MLRFGQQIRLTRREVERFTEITGFEPVNVKSLDALYAYVRECKKHYWGESDDTRFLHYLIDRELQAALALPTAANASAPTPSTTTAPGAGAGSDAGAAAG